jgi:hypothetical protein
MLINKLIKAYIKEYEDQWIEDHFDEWEAGKWLVGECRILLTHWVAKVFKRVHLEYKDAIIACFKSVGLSLVIDSSEDHLLNVWDCLNLTIRDWQQAPEGIKEALISIDDNVEDMIEVEDEDNSLLYTIWEVAERIKIKVEDENNVTIDLRVSFDEAFDPDSKSDFDDDIDSDEDRDNENIWFHFSVFNLIYYIYSFTVFNLAYIASKSMIKNPFLLESLCLDWPREGLLIKDYGLIKNRHLV